VVREGMGEDRERPVEVLLGETPGSREKTPKVRKGNHHEVPLNIGPFLKGKSRKAYRRAASATRVGQDRKGKAMNTQLVRGLLRLIEPACFPEH